MHLNKTSTSRPARRSATAAVHCSLRSNTPLRHATAAHAPVSKPCPSNDAQSYGTYVNTSTVDSITNRRAILGSLIIGGSLVAFPEEVSANPISDFLRSRQRQNGGSKLLAPLKLAQVRLQNAAMLLETGTPEGIKAALQAVRASSLNCYIFNPLEEDTIETKASLVTQQLKLSDPCTFRIVIKSVTSFKSIPQSIKAESQQLLADLIISYEDLDAQLIRAQTGGPVDVEKAKQQLVTTLQLAADIEGLVAEVLDV